MRVEAPDVAVDGVAGEFGVEDAPVAPPLGPVGREEAPRDEADLLVAVLDVCLRWLEKESRGIPHKQVNTVAIPQYIACNTDTYRCPFGKTSAGPVTIWRTYSGSTTSSE